jgi:hypothetical protein
MAADEAHIQMAPQRNIKMFTAGHREIFKPGIKESRLIPCGQRYPEVRKCDQPTPQKISQNDWEVASRFEMCLRYSEQCLCRSPKYRTPPTGIEQLSQCELVAASVHPICSVLERRVLIIMLNPSG